MQRRTLLSVATAADSEPAFEFANDYDDLHVWVVDGFGVSVSCHSVLLSCFWHTITKFNQGVGFYYH